MYIVQKAIASNQGYLEPASNHGAKVFLNSPPWIMYFTVIDMKSDAVMVAIVLSWDFVFMFLCLDMVL